MTTLSEDAINAIRNVRIASHNLYNVCAALVGGVETALSVDTIKVVGEELEPSITTRVEKLEDRCSKLKHRVKPPQEGGNNA